MYIFQVLRFGWMVMALVTACSGAGSSLEGKKWTQLPVGPWGVSPFANDLAFDTDGNIVVLVDQDAYRLDTKTRKWTTLGRPSPVMGQNSPPFRDLEGAVYTLRRKVPDDLYRLDGDQWTLVGAMHARGASVAFGAGNVLFEADFDQSTSALNLYRGTPPNAVMTFTGQSPAFFDMLVNDQAGHVFAELVETTRQISPDGTQLLLPFDCIPQSQESYCKIALSLFNADEHGQQEFVRGSSVQGDEFYRVPAGATHPTLVTNADKSLARPAIFLIQYDRHGNLYVVGNSDFNQTDPTLYEMDDDSSEWHEIGPMGPVGKYDMQGVLRVRDDGTVFSFDNMTGTIGILE